MWFFAPDNEEKECEFLSLMFSGTQITCFICGGFHKSSNDISIWVISNLAISVQLFNFFSP